MMQKLFTVLIWVLGCIVVAVLFWAFYGTYLLLTAPTIQENNPTYFPYGPLRTIIIVPAPQQHMAMTQRWGLLPTIVMSAGVLIAILAFLRDRNKHEVDRQRETSKVLFDRACEGFSTVVDLLSDQNNDRITWIRAARTLLKTRELKSQIKSEEYALAYALEEEKTRNKLYSKLLHPNQKTGELEPLPPQFFYGISDWGTCATLDDAAIKAAQQVQVYSASIDAVPPQSSLKPIAPPSIVVIYEFIAYPDTYEDPLTPYR